MGAGLRRWKRMLLLAAITVVPSYCFAEGIPSTLLGKTVEYKGESKSCLTKKPTDCVRHRAAIKIYFAKDGKIFTYFSMDKSLGVIIPKGKTSSSKYDPATKARQYSKINYYGDQISANFEVKYDNGFRYYNSSSINIFNNKCKLVS